MPDSVSIKFDQRSVDAWLDGLQAKARAAIRPAAQAGAQVLYNEVSLNVSRIGKVTGNLASSIYQVYSKDNSTADRATYHISWNARKAPHGHLVEYGHIQRYAAFVGRDGKWHTAVRPSKRGTPKPSRKASTAVKDAYYVPLSGGPVQVAANPFVRPSYAKAQEALQAAKARFELELAK